MASEPGATMKELPTDGVFAGRPTILPFEGTLAQRVSPAREGERAVGAAAGLLDLGRRDGDAEDKNAQEIRGLSLPVQLASAAPRMRQLSRDSWRPEPGYANPEVRQSDRLLHVNGVAELVSVCFKRRLQLCIFFCLTLSANDA